jgi:uncharacterized protein YcbK (DUF882 family)
MVIRNRFDDEVRSAARRRFLVQAGACCGAVAVLGSGLAPAAESTTGPATGPTDARRLRFVHTHTGETLSTEYFDGRNYAAEALTQVNQLLRDFRTGDVHVIDPALLDLLYDLQVRADHDAPFEIISGYRSPATNAMLRGRSSGVAEHSQHLLGKAIDVRLEGYATRSLGAHARELARGGVGFYAASDFVHIDTGSVRTW